MAQPEAAPTGITETYVPKPPLRNFVDLIWRYDGLVQPHDFERVLPTGTMGIIVNLAEDQIRIYEQDPHVVKTLPGGIVFGPYSRYFVIDTAEQASVLGVSFSPGGAAPFLRMPAAEARDMQLSVEDVWGTPLPDTCETACWKQVRLSGTESWRTGSLSERRAT